MQVRLIVQDRTRRILKFNSEIILIGRGKHSSVKVPSSEVSRQHCRILQQAGFLILEDLSSVNGTFRNGERIVGQSVLCPGDRIEVGPIEFVVAYELTEAGRTQLEAFSEQSGGTNAKPSRNSNEEDGDDVDWLHTNKADNTIDVEPIPIEVLDDDLKSSAKLIGDDDQFELPTDLQLKDLLDGES